MKEILRNREVRMVVTGIAAITGIFAIGYAEVDAFLVNSPARIEKRTEQLVPGYNPEAFRKAERVVSDFKQQADLTAKTIQVPEEVTQAAVFIRDEQKRGAYNEGTKLSQEMIGNRMNRNLKIAWGGFALFIPSGLALATDAFKSNRHRNANERTSSPAQTQS